MNKQTILQLINDNYHSFADYINDLTADEYSFSYKNKWTAAQQLEHIVLCLSPLVQVFSMDKPMIEQYFGKTEREGQDYETLLTAYKEKLNEGGKAPKQYVPDNEIQNQKEMLIGKLVHLVKALCLKIETFSDHELDTLLIPHPLLGKLTLREMLYNAIYHVEHHKEQTILHLNK